MAWIRTLDEHEATGPLKARFEADLDRLGFVMEATKAVSIKPDLALAWEEFEAAVKRASSLTPRERRLIHLAVAQRIASRYCVLVYGSAAERDLGGLTGVRAFLRDYRSAGLGDREVAILDYALATADGHPTEDHVRRLREVGLDDGAIIDVAVTAALRLFGSRIYDALGIQTDPFFLEQTDLVEVVDAGSRAV
jgi:uncharacterized peroxidase-related enzyme